MPDNLLLLTKFCTSCEKEVSRFSFWRNSYSKDGLQTQCVFCSRKRKAEIYQKLKDEIFKFYGDKCNRCSFQDRRALQIDHINGGGHQEKVNFGEGMELVKRVLKYPERYQILCANCNWIKRYENKEVRGTYTR